MAPVDCASCGQRVLVEKYSSIHTGIQWPAAENVRCPYRDIQVNTLQPGSLVQSCSGLSDAVQAAIESGKLRESPRPEGLSHVSNHR
ncbi:MULTISPECIES: hypothetical protein [Rhodococcus]|uniref:Uncharacterized protein n=1 Tax=Rhodococcus globerulus TaxID=33008 RepID=A0ABU4C040_RHOGO|nr:MULTISPECIES: hypothetical protein [Rhodococcus]MDV6269679.1 hypothetical protein [Rhodococcus globerulus]MDV8065347.1 hypothetical protein [Rhodococcus sp. IEGM 1366]